MRLTPLLFAACGFIIYLNGPAAVFGQPKKEIGQYDPPAIVMPSREQLQQIQTKTAQLAAKVAELRKQKANDAWLPDVEIYLRGAENIVRFSEFFSKDSGKWTLAALDQGLQRAEQLAKKETPWRSLETRNVLRAYRSKIDGTAQPYGVTYPLDYGKDRKRKWRVDVVLHGRNSSLTEVAFLNAHNGKKMVSPDQDWVQIDVFGRGNNAYRWAGETDVMEAMEAFFQNEMNSNERYGLPDRNRVVLRGFSMGGAGTWHLGLRHPDKWCVIGPGAGFTTTHGYAGKLVADKLPDYQEKCLRIYDAIDYAENARMIPIVAYSGGADPQKLAADNIENRLKELKIGGMTHLVAPGLGHTMPADWFKKANHLWSEYATKGRDPLSKKVSFVTYTTKAPACESVWIDGLEKHYEKASVDLEMTDQGCRVTTKNVRALLVMPTLGTQLIPTPSKRAPKPPAIIQIDGQEVISEPRFQIMAGVLLEKHNGKWKGRDRIEYFEKRGGSTKRPSQQGPIDDAFTQAFICVLGSGDAFHPATQKFVDAKVKAFQHDWAKHWRGALPTATDNALTAEDIRDKNLILFGDPSSNRTLAKMLDKLPLKWTKDEIEFAGQKFKASEHVPVMIFPNPLNSSRYVVLNTGHTWPSEDYNKTNAMLFPRLGDYAILRMTPNASNAAAYEAATAGLFDEYWRVEKK